MRLEIRLVGMLLDEKGSAFQKPRVNNDPPKKRMSDGRFERNGGRGTDAIGGKYSSYCSSLNSSFSMLLISIKLQGVRSTNATFPNDTSDAILVASRKAEKRTRSAESLMPSTESKSLGGSVRSQTNEERLTGTGSADGGIEELKFLDQMDGVE